MIHDTPPPLDVDELHQMMRDPYLYNPDTLAAALYRVLCRLEQAEQERDRARVWSKAWKAEAWSERRFYGAEVHSRKEDRERLAQADAALAAAQARETAMRLVLDTVYDAFDALVPNRGGWEGTSNGQHRMILHAREAYHALAAAPQETQ